MTHFQAAPSMGIHRGLEAQCINASKSLSVTTYISVYINISNGVCINICQGYSATKSVFHTTYEQIYKAFEKNISFLPSVCLLDLSFYPIEYRELCYITLLLFLLVNPSTYPSFNPSISQSVYQ